VRFRSLVIALLLMSFLVPAAGAIYIPGQEIPNDGQPHILLADSGSGAYPVPDTGGPIKRYMSDDPNDYVLVPGNDPGMMYALGEMPVEPQPSVISTPVTISANMPSYVGKPPSVPPIQSMAASTSSETVMPPDFNAPSSSSKFTPSISGLQHTNAAMRGYDVSKIGNIVMPSTPAGAGTKIGMPEFKFPALFG
jgi:hypothetical protein